MEHNAMQEWEKTSEQLSAAAAVVVAEAENMEKISEAAAADNGSVPAQTKVEDTVDDEEIEDCMNPSILTAADDRTPDCPVPAIESEDALTEKGIRVLSILSVLLRVFCLCACLIGAAVYILSAYFRVNTLLAGGMDRLILGEIAGGTDMICIQTIPQSSAELPDTALPPLAQIAPVPANEAEMGAPSSVSGERLCEDLSSRGADGLGLINETPYEPSLSTLADNPMPIRKLNELQAIYGEEAPICLILHTHGTEGYLDSAASGYHTSDKDRSVIRLGMTMAETLTENGIPTIHCTTLFDENRFDSAYYNASLVIREYLQTYPSISYILDIHRDAIEWNDSSGNLHGIAPYTEENGIGCAQLMFVVGTDHGGSGHTDWQDNLTLAVHLQKKLHETHPGLCRDINLRSASFNEQYTKGSLLIEAGAASSTLEEALHAIALFTEAFIQVIRGQ